MKHIFIGGTSFCGSTLMGLVLGSLPETVNVGESHWLIWPRGRSRKRGEEFLECNEENVGDFVSCRLCDWCCRVFDLSFRRTLQNASRSDYYRLISERLGTDCLISSEKSMNNLRTLSDNKEFDMLIMYKEPAEFMRSCRKRRGRNQDSGRILRNWRKTYIKLLDFANTGKKIALNIRRFQNEPRLTLMALTKILGLSFDEEALRYWRKKQHYIGGNFNVYQRLAENGEEAMQIRADKHFPLDEETLAKVQNDSETQKVYARLRKLSFRVC